MKRILFALIAVTLFTFVACSGGGSNSDSSATIRFSSFSNGSAVSGLRKAPSTDYGTGDQYAGSGFTHVDALIFHSVPAIIAYQVDEANDGDNTLNVVRWDIFKEMVATSDVPSIMKDGDGFTAGSSNQFWSFASNNSIPAITDIEDCMKYSALSAPSTVRVDYIEVKTPSINLYGVTTGGEKSFVFADYMNGGTLSDVIDDNNEFWRDVYGLITNSGLFPNIADYKSYKYTGVANTSLVYGLGVQNTSFHLI